MSGSFASVPTAERAENIQIIFDFGTGDIQLVFEDASTYTYKSSLGTDIAECFEALVDEAFDAYTLEAQRKERLKKVH